jgi:DNA-binding NarL/FixJ family response regulator
MVTPLLVGREQESTRLQTALERAIGGQGSSVLVSGEAGIGKTTLVQSLAAEARSRGAGIYAGACYDLTATPPYGLWRDLIARAAPVLGAASPLAPLLEDAAWEEAENIGALIRRVREALEGLAADSPMVLVLEDLHWADPSSLELLRDLVRRVGSARTLVLATYRGDEIGREHPLYPLIPAMVREGAADRIDLRPLTGPAMVELVERGHPGLESSDRDRLVAYLVRHAEGNALFATELLRSLEETGALQRTDDRWLLGDLETAQVPSLLRQVIDGRVARLGKAARRPLEIASVIGHEVPLGAWSTVAEIEEEALLEVIEPAVAAKVLVPTGDGEAVAFAHALIREAIYDGILPPRRRAWHRAAAEALASLPNPDPDAVGHHFARAGDPRASEWLVRAGERAQRAYAQGLAGSRFAEAAAALELHDPQSPERVWLLYRGGRCLRLHDVPSAIALLTQAQELSARTGDPVVQAYVRFDLGMLRCMRGKSIVNGIETMEAGLRMLEGMALEECRRAGRADWVADALPRHGAGLPGDELAGASGLDAGITRAGALALWYAYVGRFREVEPIVERYRRILDTALMDDMLVIGAAADAFLGAGYAAAEAGRPDVAQDAYVAASELSHRLGHHAVEAWSHSSHLSDVVLKYQTTDRALRAELLSKSVAAYLSGDEALPGIWHHEQNTPDLLVFLGEWQRARLAAQAAQDSGDVTVWPTGAVASASIARWRGEPDPLRMIPAELQRLRAAVDTKTLFKGAIEALVLQADVAMDVGELGPARQWIEIHARWIAESGAIRHRPATELLWSRWQLLHGDAAEAERTATKAIDLASDPEQPPLLGAALRAHAEALGALGRFDEAVAAAQESIDLFAACEAPFERARSEVVLAELLAKQKLAPAARELLASARAVAEPLGAKRLLDQIDALEARFAGPPALPVDYPSGLSVREVEVLRLVATGMTNAEVAAQLSISDRTVGQHLRSIFEKIEVSTRAAATRWAVDNGIA